MDGHSSRQRGKGPSIPDLDLEKDECLPMSSFEFRYCQVEKQSPKKETLCKTLCIGLRGKGGETGRIQQKNPKQDCGIR